MTGGAASTETKCDCLRAARGAKSMLTKFGEQGAVFASRKAVSLNGERRLERRGCTEG